MAVNLTQPTALTSISGIRLASSAAGIRYPNRKDLVLMELAESAHCAAVFTRNAFCAAPVTVAKQHLSKACTRYLLINSGNANAGLGTQGMDAAHKCCQAIAKYMQCQAEQVLPFSTGVIGEPLPVARIEAAIPKLQQNLTLDGWMEAMQAIMTTDTVAKGVSRSITVQGQTINITGIAKGSGMIAPNMATMLAFLATDAVMDQASLQTLLSGCVARSFNCITVDGDTSTNDACVFVATGQSGVSMPVLGHDMENFRQAVLDVCQTLAQAIVRDGEGATKFIRVRVRNAATYAEARQVGLTIANSPLVKTALFASDPNWGRILAAVGRAGIEDLDVTRINMELGDVRIVTQGGRDPRYTEADGQRIMALDEIILGIDLARGVQAAEIYTCDFSHEYIRINAEYRS